MEELPIAQVAEGLKSVLVGVSSFVLEIFFILFFVVASLVVLLGEEILVVVELVQPSKMARSSEGWRFPDLFLLVERRTRPETKSCCLNVGQLLNSTHVDLWSI